MRLPVQFVGVSRQVIETPVQAGVISSRFSWINVGLPELAWGYWKQFADLTGGRPSPGSCELGCGEERADCFREGGSRNKCDQLQRECMMDCFFTKNNIT